MCESLLVCVCQKDIHTRLSHVLFTAVNHSRQSHSLTFNLKSPERNRERFSLLVLLPLKWPQDANVSLLPFFILVDYKVKIMKRNVLIHLNTVAKNKKLSQHCTFFHYVLLLLEHFPLTIFDIQCLIVTSLCWLCCNYRAVPYCDIILKKNVVETLTNCLISQIITK